MEGREQHGTFFIFIATLTSPCSNAHFMALGNCKQNGSELWIVQDEASANIRYVDLHVNPEGYTG